MNLLFYAPQMAPYGGMERHICSLAAAAAQRGHVVRFLTTSNSLGAELRRELDVPGLKLRELAVPRTHAPGWRKLVWVIQETLKARAYRWDLIYTNGQSGLARYVWMAQDRGRTRIVHHHHTAADADEQTTWGRGFRRVLNTSPELVGCSEATRHAMNAATGRQDAIFLPYLTRCPVASDRVQDRPASRPVRFGFLGRLIPEKGVDVVLKLAEAPGLEHVEWHIHGAGEAYPPERFQKLSRLRYHGAYTSAAQHASILQGLDAVVLFSQHNEGMPLSLIESMSAGLPWLASDRGGVKEIAAVAKHAWLVPVDATHERVVDLTREASNALLEGRCSRVAQRKAYDQVFAPETVTKRWLDYFEKGGGVRR